VKVENILDFFGPRVNCRTKIKYVGEDEYCYERDDDYPTDEILLNSYVVEINIEQDDYGPFLELVTEDGKW
jgi:hypothetical protein